MPFTSDNSLGVKFRDNLDLSEVERWICSGDEGARFSPLESERSDPKSLSETKGSRKANKNTVGIKFLGTLSWATFTDAGSLIRISRSC